MVTDLVEERPVHYWRRRRFQDGWNLTEVDTDCGVTVPIKRASQIMEDVTCLRCRKSKR